MGIQINGQTDTIKAIDGTMTLPGTVTYEDVSRINVVGVVTAASFNSTTGNVTITENANVMFQNSARNTNRGAIQFNDSGDFRVRSGALLTETLRITSSGNVGIGTDNPQRPVHILASEPFIRLSDSDIGSTVYGEFTSNVAGDLYFSADPNNSASNTKISFVVDGSEKLNIGSGHIGISTFVIAGQTDPVSTANTTAHIQSASQIIAVQGVLTRNGGWSMLPTTRVTLNKASDSINGHTVVIDTAGLNGANHATLIRVSFAMRRGNTDAAMVQKSEYMGLWDITKNSSTEHIDVNHIVQRELTVTSTTYASNTITMTFNTDNVRSFTARAFEYCTTGALYTGV